MKILDRILKELEELRKASEPDLVLYSEAASLLRRANEEAIYAGVHPVPVREFVNPVNAIASVNQIARALQPEQLLTVAEAAVALRMRVSGVRKLIEEDRLQASNVGKKAKPDYRITQHALANILPERTKVYKPKYL